MPKALVNFVSDSGELVQVGDEVAVPHERAKVLQKLNLIDDSPPRWARGPATPVPDVPEPPVPSVAITRSGSGQGVALRLGRVRE